MTELSTWRVVLIDDEEDIRTVMTIALEDAGYDVYQAPDGPKGLDLCERINPEIVITDIRMPGMTGIQVLESIKQTNPDIEVIVFTAFGEMDLAIHALQLDASDFITKPVHDDALHLALKRAKERYSSRKKLKDYTHLLEAEQARTVSELRKTISLQKNLVESSMDGILACDKDGRVVIFNQSMEKLLGYEKAAVLHKMTFDLFFDATEREKLNHELVGERFGGCGRLFLYETELKDAADHKVPVQLSLVELFRQGTKDGWVCFFRDLREIHKLEREMADQARILHQDKMMSLGRLAASVVHEINNPLSGILNYARLMLKVLSRGSLDANQEEKFKQYLELVENETDRCSQIVSNLLAFSRKTDLTFEKVSTAELIHRCTLLSQHKLALQNIQLESRVDQDIPQVNGDFNQLQQCLINLIFNAVDAMPNGGRLTISGTYDQPMGWVSISVEDTGGGIAKEHLPYIFEPFFTTKNEGYGVGLGLSTVYGIVERHKGRVKVDTKPDEGSTFTISLPA